MAKNIRTFSTEDGYSVEDMLHFGYGHIEAAYALFESDDVFMDSAGYLAHLGTEILLKAWLLHCTGKFEETHGLVSMHQKLKNIVDKLDIGKKNEAFLRELDDLYELRYPRKNKPIEIGTDQLVALDALLEAIWQKFPKEIIDVYQKLNPNKKGGRILMEKKL